jgi:hypothetical protein
LLGGLALGLSVPLAGVAEAAPAAELGQRVVGPFKLMVDQKAIGSFDTIVEITTRRPPDSTGGLGAGTADPAIIVLADGSELTPELKKWAGAGMNAGVPAGRTASGMSPGEVSPGAVKQARLTLSNPKGTRKVEYAFKNAVVTELELAASGATNTVRLLTIESYDLLLSFTTAGEDGKVQNLTKELGWNRVNPPKGVQP